LTVRETRPVELKPERRAVELTERQLRITDRLDALSPALGDLFRAAVDQLQERGGRAWVRLAAHACREIVNRVPDYLDLPIASTRVEYGQRFREIAQRWPDDPSETPGTEVLELVARLVEEDRAVAANMRERAEALFQALENGDVLYAGDAAARSTMWVELQRYFHRVAHVGGPAVPDPDIDEFERYFARLERLLASQFRAEGYYESQADLDELITKAAPTEDDADAVVALLRGELYRSFFERVQSPAWLPLLKGRGYFKSAPKRIIEGQYMRFPAWPESRYLVRIAPEVPEDVASTIVEMDTTDNPRVHSDLLEAALAMPASSAALVSELAGDWLDGSSLMLVADRAGALVAKLAGAGEIEPAARLARQLLALRESPPEAHASFSALFEIKAQIDDWEYQQFLERHFPHLAAASPLEAIRILCDVLRAAILLERKRWQTERDDGMKIVREGIDQHEQFPALENALITALRDATVLLVEQRPEDAGSIVELLHDRNDLLFRRLELHLVTVADAPALAERRKVLVADDDLYSNYAVEYEYEQLLERSFPALDAVDRQGILNRIETGPDEEYRQFVTDRIREEREPSEGELEEQWERWRLRRLAPIKDALEGEDAERYRARVERLGEPTYPEDTSRVASFVGSTTSLSADDLRAMDSAEVLAFLRDWEPQNEWHAPTREGQGQALTMVIADEPDVWAQRANDFQDVPPIYSRHLFQALESALRADRAIESWEPILELAEFVVAQPVAEGAEPSFDDDHDYQPSRRALAHLLHTALAKQAVPFAYRERVWTLIEVFAHDPDPAPESDREATDPAGASINRTRGIALHAAIAYGLWCARHLDNEERSLAATPELRELLEEKLDVEREPARAVRAVFGQHLPYLLFLDREWTEQHLQLIFPPQEGLEPYRAAAWGAFIRFARFDREVIALLLPEFRHAISQLPADATERLGDEHTRLAEYVAEIYLADLDDRDDPIVHEFFRQASPAHRTHAIRHLGLSLRGHDWSPENCQRLEELWQQRLDALDDRDPELHEYGWWFSSGQFSGDRGLALLVSTLEKSGGVVDNAKEVLEALAPLARRHQELANRTLELTIAGSEWYVLDYSRDAIRAVLEAVLGGDDEPAKEGARRLIHGLGEKGVHGMQDLLGTD
jgi:hypothetical protein